MRVSGVLFGLAVTAGGLVMASCTTWKPVVLPSGQHGYTVDCSGSNLSWSHCYRKAGHACPDGYDIVQRTDHRGGHPVAGDLFGVMGGSVVDRGMLIACRQHPVAAGAVPAVHSTDGAVVPAGTASGVPTGGAETFPIGEGFHPNATPPPTSSGR